MSESASSSLVVGAGYLRRYGCDDYVPGVDGGVDCSGKVWVGSVVISGEIYRCMGAAHEDDSIGRIFIAVIGPIKVGDFSGCVDGKLVGSGHIDVMSELSDPGGQLNVVKNLIVIRDGQEVRVNRLRIRAVMRRGKGVGKVMDFVLFPDEEQTP